MVARVVAALLALLSIPAVALAQQQSPPAPAYPGAVPHSFEVQPLPPPPAAVESTRPTNATAPAELPPPAAAAVVDAPATAPPMSAPAERVFCEQAVTVQLADPDAVAERFRPFIGVWSDASWTPQLCAALIVENVAPDGTATIVYLFGPMGSSARGAAGVLQGTGMIRDGELRFQNSDGSQFAFRPLYADLDGHFIAPRGQSYQAIFKKTP
jgi:hypothetical protein